MTRTFSIKEWDARGRRMAALAARFDTPIVRPPLEAQLGKSAEKKELLRRMYGPTGQPRTA